MEIIDECTGIYLLTHIESGRKYVGQSTNMPARLRSHSQGGERGAVGRAIRDYGWQAFNAEVIEVCKSEQLNARECHWIATHDSQSPFGFNQQQGGHIVDRGDGLVKATANIRSARSRATREAAGSKQIAVMLTPAAALALTWHMRYGKTATAAICDLLVRDACKPRRNAK